MRIFLLLILTLALGPALNAKELTPEKYREIFNTENTLAKKKTIESLAWAGISSPEVFDPLEKDLLAEYKNAVGGEAIDYLAWIARGLGYSGNRKYSDTLAKVSAHAWSRKLRKYAAYGLEVMDQYEQWNVLIAPEYHNGGAYPSQNERFMSMFESENLQLIRITAKRIHFENNYDPELMQSAVRTLEAHYRESGDDTFVDAMAWTTKAIAGSGDEKYRALIEEVSENAGEPKLQRYAKKYLNYLNR